MGGFKVALVLSLPSCSNASVASFLGRQDRQEMPVDRSDPAATDDGDGVEANVNQVRDMHLPYPAFPFHVSSHGLYRRD
jgi:hypothetical protein